MLSTCQLASLEPRVVCFESSIDQSTQLRYGYCDLKIKSLLASVDKLRLCWPSRFLHPPKEGQGLFMHTRDINLIKSILMRCT